MPTVCTDTRGCTRTPSTRATRRGAHGDPLLATPRCPHTHGDRVRVPAATVPPAPVGMAPSVGTSGTPGHCPQMTPSRCCRFPALGRGRMAPVPPWHHHGTGDKPPCHGGGAAGPSSRRSSPCSPPARVRGTWRRSSKLADTRLRKRLGASRRPQKREDRPRCREEPPEALSPPRPCSHQRVCAHTRGSPAPCTEAHTNTRVCSSSPAAAP